MIGKIKLRSFRCWMIICLANFFLVAILGLLMRTNVIFPLKGVNQTYILHAHSHFAFSGWIAQLLMLFLVKEIFSLAYQSPIPRKYLWFFVLNVTLSFGMLISFAYSGYSVPSIICSFLIVLLSYLFSFLLWKDIGHSTVPVGLKYLFKSALFFNIFSSLGTYSLVFLKVTHMADEQMLLASINFYLHFQYNGWFMMASLGLFLLWVFRQHGKLLLKDLQIKILVFTIVPTYLLSVLWWKNFPNVLFYILVVTALFQFLVWGRFFINLFYMGIASWSPGLRAYQKGIWIFVLCALIIKVVLQTLAILPALAPYTYGFRPILIAYLHLVLLAIISLFLIAYAFSTNLLVDTKFTSLGVFGLLLGVFLNEVILMTHGLGSYFQVKYSLITQALFSAAALIAVSIAILLLTQIFSYKKSSPYDS